ncbi:GAF and ANTAR domain-containing protein [Kribbella sp. CA-293567]|uniref:GAF and ANTAR domain-containing protein n=1 Tax=Kribbella sp. CA-293567 TaxID=3002436 RepID=UPI0022DE20EB|nr:GAF and ANTAR domain-containing protein [Kribbella sp. CA-293567]WBQ04731.1 GAF and ANTAR domain-containing protein [Kribbella sp. CA-293567]
MNDELAQVLARMALELYEQPDVEQTVERFLTYARTAIGVDHASVVLVQRGGGLDSEAVTGALAEEADRRQFEVGQGPTLVAVNDQLIVVSADVTTDPRWPAWTVQGLRSALSVRLRTPESTVGALTLYAPTPDRFTSRDTVVAKVYADHAAVAVANARTEATLWEAIEARKLIGQAQGMLMERFNLTGDQAFGVLRRYSQDSNIKLRDVAQRLIATRNLGENL